MKKQQLSFALVLAGVCLARADDPPAAPPPPPSSAATPADGGDQAPPPHRRHGMRGAFVLGELTEKLALSADQQKTVAAIIAAGEAQTRALRQDESISQEDKRAKFRSILGQERGQIRAVLTPEQQKTFDTLGRRQGKGGEAPQPPAPSN